MKNGLKIIFTILFLFPLVGITFHCFYLRDSILLAYEGKSDSFIQFIINNFYPRFNVEKIRFDSAFFINKADQVLIRFLLVYYLTLVVFYLYHKTVEFKKLISSFFQTETTSKNIHLLRILYFAYFLYLSGQLCHDLEFMQPLAPFYKPVLWLRILHIPFPNHYTILILGGIWYLLN